MAVNIVFLPLFMFGVGTIIALYMLKQKIRKRVKNIEDSFRSKNVIKSDIHSNFMGLESLGFKQVRGKGGLYLTNDTLHYFMYFPERDYSIPLITIFKVETVNSFLGKSIAKQLLKVSFHEDINQGKTNSCAWYVRDIDSWVITLNNILGRQDGY